jgi:hypothetical protein
MESHQLVESSQDFNSLKLILTGKATEKPSTIPLYELLTLQHATQLAVSDGGADVLWLLRLGTSTEHEILWDCKGIARGYPMQSYRVEGYGRLSLLSFLTHYRYIMYKHRTTYASPPTATTRVCSKPRKNSTLGILSPNTCWRRVFLCSCT